MKLLCLNLWGGRLFESLASFLETKRDIEIFCFQEIYHSAQDTYADTERQPNLDLLSELEEILPNHLPFYRPVIKGQYGIGMFVKKDVRVDEEGEVILFENPDYIRGGNHTRNLQWAKISVADKTYTIFNAHGFHNSDKLDSPERLEQSRRIKDQLDKTAGPKILCGDFNLTIDTQSLLMLEEGGAMINLVREKGISSTRTHHYTKPVKFADYMLVSPDIKVTDFKVLPDVVSDHSPLLLEFE